AAKITHVLIVVPDAGATDDQPAGVRVRALEVGEGAQQIQAVLARFDPAHAQYQRGAVGDAMSGSELPRELWSLWREATTGDTVLDHGGFQPKHGAHGRVRRPADAHAGVRHVYRTRLASP